MNRLWVLLVAPLLPSKATIRSFETLEFPQLVDHSSFYSKSGNFSQRYLFSEVQDPTAILFYCGNEGPIEAFANATGNALPGTSHFV